jgi:hypothetical protein
MTQAHGYVSQPLLILVNFKNGMGNIPSNIGL